MKLPIHYSKANPKTRKRNNLRIIIKHKLADNITISENRRDIIYTLDLKLEDLLRGEFETDIELIDGEKHHVFIDEYSDPAEKFIFKGFGITAC